MRSLDVSRRWHLTVNRTANLADLKLSVRSQNDESPCVSGLRSVCWKIFLLFHTSDTSTWSGMLNDARSAYASLREHFLKYIERPDELGSALDPLNDDKNSPWNILRQDEEMRAEIFQDVERCMPEEPYFRQPETQRMLLDILFVWCKMNQDVGYRQGMHELVAPILWVVEKDAMDPLYEKYLKKGDDELMSTTLNASYIEHDVFTIFSLLMQSAKAFYELGEADKRSSVAPGPANNQNGASPIVERSKRIHEVYLARLDPELADHLTTIEVLPQIFLIRWIRIIFGREFPFDSLLSLWDTLFAEDPALDLIDMICVAMLLRIRWQLLEANYSAALSLLLKYPYPDPPHGPQTFVEDAMFLRENFTPSDAKKIITTYSGKSPSQYTSSSRPATPSAGGPDPEQKISWRRSPLPSPARFLQQQIRVEALLQGAAKGVFERGERLGINKAVRDAVGEVKKNMQSLQSPQPTQRSSDASRWSPDEGRTIVTTRKAAVMEQRNKQLSQMLNEALNDLRKVSLQENEVASKFQSAFDLAMAKIQFVQVYLDDSSMPLPPRASENPIATKSPSESPAQSISSSGKPGTTQGNPGLPQQTKSSLHSAQQADAITSSAETNVSSTSSSPVAQSLTPVPLPTSIRGIEPGQGIPNRPRAPIPTRSTLAQSSFAFMLEPDESSISPIKSSSPKASSPLLGASRRPLSISSREKSKAFLFGDEREEAEPDTRKPTTQNGMDEEFNLEAIRGTKRR